LTQFKSHRLWGDYPTSKVFQILSAYKLKQDLFPSKLVDVFFRNLISMYLVEGVNVFAVSPGWVWTSSRLSMIEAFGFYPFLIVYPILRLLKIAFAVKCKTGARTTIYCAVEPSLEHSHDLYFE
jgi:hypothetical protein